MASYHTRSVSFPSSSHPLVHQFNENLCSLRSSSESTSSPSSFPSITTRLSGLEDLYNCVDDFLLAPKFANQTSIDEALDGFLTLLDVCATTKDIFSQTREEIKKVLSSIRRNKDCTFQGYMTSRKKTIKVIRKLLKDLKSISKKDNEDDVSGDMLKEAQAVTVSVLESLLSYVGGTKAHSKSLISTLLQKKSDPKKVASEFEQIDFSMNSLKNTEVVQNQLEKLELSAENLEDVMERLIRRLIKTRVSLLNILNHWTTEN